MAVAVGSTSTLALGNRTNSTVTAPASIANGNLLLAFVAAGATAGSAPTVTGPAGWTKYSGSPFSMTDAVGTYQMGFNVFWKIASSESGSYVFTHSAADTQAIMYRITGNDTTTPLTPALTSATNNGNSPSNVGKTATATGLTTTTPNSLVIYAVCLWDGGPGTPPTGSTPTFTERLDTGALYLADGVLATAGATGNKANASAFTAQTNTSPWYALLVAVRQPPSAAQSLSAPAGSYAFTGTAATLSKSSKSLIVPAGTYGFTGTAVTLTKASSYPAFRSEAHITYGGAVDTVVGKPTGTASGDILIALIFYGQNINYAADPTPPSGWTQIGSTLSIRDNISGVGFTSKVSCWWLRAGGSEPSSYTWTFGGSVGNTQGAIAAYSGCIASGSPIDVSSVNSATFGALTGTTATGTGVTTTAVNELLVYLQTNWDGTGTLTPPTGMTERFDGIVYIADEGIGTVGATGNRTQTLASTNPWSAFMVALKPATVTIYTLTAPAGSYSFTGTAVTVGVGLQAAAGSYAFTGVPATFRRIRIASTAIGSYGFTGTPVSLTRSALRTAVSTVGSYSFTGTPATLWRGLMGFATTAGSYSFTGTPVTVSKTQPHINVTAGSYSFTGSHAGFMYPVLIDPIPSFRAEAHTSYASGRTSTTVSKPTGTVDGDMMIMSIMAGSVDTGNILGTVPPAGWTQIGTMHLVEDVLHTFMGYWVYWKRASSEPADYTFTHTTGGVSSQAMIATYYDVRSVDDPIDAFAQGFGNSGGTATAPGITTVSGNTELIYAGHNWDGTGTLAPPTGMTERFENYLYLADEDRELAGATGSRSQTLVTSDTPWQAYLFALKSWMFSVDVEVGGSSMTVEAGEISYPWWNAETLSGTGSLSFHDMVLTSTLPGTSVSAASEISHGPGLHYVETTFTGSDPVGLHGLYNAASNIGTMIELESGNVVQRPSGTVTPTFDPIVVGDTVGIAYDGNAGKVWFRVNDGPWNNDRAQAPDSTGIGLWEIPAGVGCSGTLTPYTGPHPYKIETDGAVIENMDFQCFVFVLADNVTIRNCNIFSDEYFGIDAGLQTGCVFDHCTISSAGRSTALITGDNFVVRNCDLHDFENGIGIGSDGVIEGCYIHDLRGAPDAHVDGIQFAGNNYNTIIRDNWIESWDTSCIIVKADYGPIDNVLIENNTLTNKPGDYTAAPIFTVSITPEWPVTNITILRNRIQKGTPAFGGLYLSYDNTQPECFHNIDYDTGEPCLLFFQGFATTGQSMTVSVTDVQVPPVEPRGIGATVSGNYIGLGGNVPVQTPTHRSHNLSTYSYVADAHVPKPAGVADGDILVMVMFRGKPSEPMLEPVLFSPGWQQLGATSNFLHLNFYGQFTVWWKRAGAVEPDEYLWGFWEESNTQTYIAAYSNCSSVGPISSFSQNAGSSTTATGLGVSAMQHTDMLLWLGQNWTGSGALTPPTGMTERADSVLYIGEETLTAHGPTGDRTQVQAEDAPWTAFLVTLKGA
jgi:Right handed beta helix region